MYYALVDCNNFYASCEQLFSPRLANKPLAILSNNDGCVIARSKEAKEMGIPMGAPIFTCKTLVDSGHLQVLSSNFTLYGDMSRRVMDTLKTFGWDMEIYSIDEAFLLLPYFKKDEALEAGREVKTKIQQWTGIPVSVGIAKTKTLAKLANAIAKKEATYQGVYWLDDPQVLEPLLSQTPVEKIWGIGKKLSQLLAKKKIFSAWQLRETPDDFLRKYFPLPILQTAYELRKIPCNALETQVVTKKSITCSRTFAQKIQTWEDLQSAIAHFTSIAGEKLRSHHLLSQYLSVFLAADSLNYSFEVAHLAFPTPTAYTPNLITYAKKIALHLYQEGSTYKKAGVILTHLTLEKTVEPDIFVSPSVRQKQMRIMETIDKINNEKKSRAILFGSQRLSSKWKFAPSHKTSHFTTQWKDLPLVR